MREAEVLKLFKESNALLEGHFILSSGLHSAQYLQCALLLQDPRIAQKICSALAEKFLGTAPGGDCPRHGIDLVVGPALGGVIVSYEVARALGVPSLFSERKEGKMLLRRGFEIKPGQRVLVVEDVVTTGGSTKEVIELVRSFGAEVAGVGAIVDRSSGKASFDVGFKALLNIDVATHQPESCPLCKLGSPAVKPGSKA